MANFTPPRSMVSCSTQPGNKWTVSPEFGDALITAMRERSQSGGPLPRLPSMLQLPSMEAPETPTIHSPTKPDSAERFKMKTRVAIRDQNPHRFQIVPLREADNYSLGQTPPRERQPLETLADKGFGTRANLQSWKKGRVNENGSVLSNPIQDCSVNVDTSERPAILSERNKNVPAQEPHSITLLEPLDRPTFTNPDVPGVHLDGQSPSVNNKQTKRSSLSSNSSTSRNHLHFKSPSLGNLRTKPNLNVDLEANPLPRVTSCRKRTNTLSADHSFRPERIVSTRAMPQSDCRNLVQKDSSKRHAIYTQSLYVPVQECPRLVSRETSGPLYHDASLHTFPFRSSIPANRKTADAPLGFSAQANSALGFFDMPFETPGPLASGSQSSVSSVYSQDESTRPQTCCDQPSVLDLGHAAEIVGQEVTLPLPYHPIILELLEEVERAIQEWSIF